MTNENALKCLISAAENGVGIYQSIIAEARSRIKTIADIKIDEMPNDINTPSEENVRFWHELDGAKKDPEIVGRPCLYVLEISDATLEFNQKIVQRYLAFKGNNRWGTTGYRNITAAKKNFGLETQILYVGKVKHSIHGRMGQHFGYANPHTGSLQLIHWARGLNLKLNLHLYLLPYGSEDYLLPLEYTLAKSLKPLLGKHK